LLVGTDDLLKSGNRHSQRTLVCFPQPFEQQWQQLRQRIPILQQLGEQRREEPLIRLAKRAVASVPVKDVKTVEVAL